MPIPCQDEDAILEVPFLDGVIDPKRRRFAAENAAIVVAHPDDETIGCGALLERMRGATVILVTDGAPRNLADAHAYGFASAADYGAQRLSEVRAALAIAGVPEDRLLTLALSDQEAAHKLVDLTQQVAEICASRTINVLLTHAYEGGHPDHDATAFAVHAAARLLARRQHQVLIVEMPFYRLGEETWLFQQFRPDEGNLQITIPLDEKEKDIKSRMVAAHRTQKTTLAPFALDCEKFRPAPAYNFRELPNDGRLLYEGYDWGMSGERWRELTRSALDALGFGGRA